MGQRVLHVPSIGSSALLAEMKPNRIHNVSQQGQIGIFISDQLLKCKELLYLLLEWSQWADFVSFECSNIVGIQCCLDPGQLIPHRGSSHTYRQKGCSDT